MRLDSKDIPDHIKRLMPRMEQPAPSIPIETQFELRTEQSERELQDTIESMLRLRDILPLRQRMDKPTSGAVGWPDFTFAIGGEAFAVECKVGSNDLSDAQKRVKAQLELNGWTYILARSTEPIRELLKSNFS